MWAWSSSSSIFGSSGSTNSIGVMGSVGTSSGGSRPRGVEAGVVVEIATGMAC